MRTADPFLQMKKEEPDRYLRLDHWLQKGATIDPRDLYPAGSSKEKRRAEIANMLIPEVRVVIIVLFASVCHLVLRHAGIAVEPRLSLIAVQFFSFHFCVLFVA